MPRKTRPHPPDTSRLTAAPLRRAKEAIRHGAIQGWCRAHGLPAPTFEHRFAPPRRWRFDVCWPEKMVAVEVHGAVWTRGGHTRGQGFLDDREKIGEAIRLGWRVLEVTTTGTHPNTLYSPAMLAWCQAMLT